MDMHDPPHDPDPACLAIMQDLLGAVPVGDFLTRTWRNEGLYLPRAVAPGELLSVDALERLLRAPEAFAVLDVHLMPRDRFQPVRLTRMAEAFEGAAAGRTLQVVGLERILLDSHPMVRMVRAIEEVCRAPLKGISTFLSPPGAGLPVHHDPFEVFAVQLTGAKRWSLYGDVPPRHAYTDGYDTGTASLVADLGPGDVLYVPKCRAHQVAAGGDWALSLSIAFEPPDWLEMVEVLRETLEDDPAFWRSVGPGGVAEGVERRRAALLRAVEALDADAVAARVEADRRRVIPGLPGPVIGGLLEAGEIGPDTLLRLADGPRPWIETGQGTVTIAGPLGGVEAPARAAPALGFVAAARGPFRAGEICSRLADASKLLLVRRLVRRGMVCRAGGQVVPD